MGQTLPISAGSRNGHDGTSVPGHLRQPLGTSVPPLSPSAGAPLGPSKWEKFHPLEPKVCPKVSSAFPRVRTAEQRRSRSGTAAKTVRACANAAVCICLPLPPSLVHVAQINNFFPPLLSSFSAMMLFGRDRRRRHCVSPEPATTPGGTDERSVRLPSASCTPSPLCSAPPTVSIGLEYLHLPACLPCLIRGGGGGG